MSRVRLALAWLVTRHPKFRPLYHADVVSSEPLTQAEFLTGAGFYVAAAMLARWALEARVKRLAMLQPRFHACRAKDPAAMAGFLYAEGAIDNKVRHNIARLYTRASKLSHGIEDASVRGRCLAVVTETRNTMRQLDEAAVRTLEGRSLFQSTEITAGLVAEFDPATPVLAGGVA